MCTSERLQVHFAEVNVVVVDTSGELVERNLTSSKRRSEMKDWVKMVDRSCWDQSFVDADSTGRCVSCAERFIDVFQLDDANWLDGFPPRAVVRKSNSLVEGSSWASAALDEDAVVQRLNRFCTDPPVILCSSPSSGPDSGRASTSDDRVYQNGFLAVDGQSSLSSSTSAEPGSAELCPESSDLIVLDSGAFSESSSSSSTAARTASEALTGPARCTSHSTSCDVEAATQSWVTTTAAGAAYSRVASFLPAWDAERLESAYRLLAACGFYCGRMTMDEATERLSRWPVGAFLLRDSSDRRYLFSLSVQTCRGTTSIRMSYLSGLFRLDCSPDQEHLMPTFDCPLRLVNHYVRLCSGGGRGSDSTSTARRVHRNRHSYVLLETSGRRDTPVLLIQPYRERPPSLAHLCRRTIQRALYGGGCGESGRDAAVDRLQLQPSLKTYLKQYPYDV